MKNLTVLGLILSLFAALAVVPGRATADMCGGVLTALEHIPPDSPGYARVLEKAQTDCPDAMELAALAALYHSTNGDDWVDDTGWLTEAPHCTWHGVSCDDMGRVVLLYLPRNQLSGSIPAELSNLTNLVRLEFNDNELGGPIPPELGQLSNLWFLLLAENQLSGTIPPELGDLTNLIQLDLHQNQLSGTIPPELNDLTNLESLVLTANQLSGTIPPELGDLTNLRHLVLRHNELTGTIPPELGNLASLTHLDLSYNQLSEAVPAILGDLTDLVSLDLYDTDVCWPPDFRPKVCGGSWEIIYSGPCTLCP